MRRGLPPKRPKAPSIEEQEKHDEEQRAEYACPNCEGIGVFYPGADDEEECVMCEGTGRIAPFSDYVHRGQHPASCPWCQATEFDMEEREAKAREGGV